MTKKQKRLYMVIYSNSDGDEVNVEYSEEYCPKIGDIDYFPNYGYMRVTEIIEI